MADLRKKTKQVIIVIIIVIMMEIGFTIYPLFLDINEQEEGLTAMGGKKTSQLIANQCIDNATLYKVCLAIGFKFYEKTVAWTYIFSNNNATNNITRRIMIVIYVYGYKYAQVSYSEGDLNDTPIENWEIDSDEAIDIALNNDTLNMFLKNHETIGHSFFLKMTYQGYPIWNISWKRPQGLYSSREVIASIKINYRTPRGCSIYLLV